MNSELSKPQRGDAVLDVLRAIEQERYNTGCPYTAHDCQYRSEAHNLVWHFDPYAPQLEPSPLLTQIGALPELVRKILSHLDHHDLYRCVRVNKTWAKEAVRFIWHSPDCVRLLSTPITVARAEEYAALVRHIVYTACTGKHLEPRFRGFGPGYSTTRPLPNLPGLTSVDCESNSLCDRTIEELSFIFVPTLKRLAVRQYAAYAWDRPIQYHSQLQGVSWFDIMARNCLRLSSINLGAGLHIDTPTFNRFLKNAAHLDSVVLGSGNEHLLVDELASILKSIEITIRHDSYDNNAIILGQLQKMHALEHLEVTLWDLWLTSSDILETKGLTKLKSLKVRSKTGQAHTGCSATAGEPAEMIEAMPFLSEFKLDIVCTFMEGHPELLRDEWEIGTYFEDHSCRQQYLNFLHELAKEDRASAVAVSDTI